MITLDRLTLCMATPRPLAIYRATLTSTGGADGRPTIHVRAQIPPDLEPASQDQVMAFFELYLAAQTDHVQWGGRIERCGFGAEELPGWYVAAHLEPVYGRAA